MLDYFVSMITMIPTAGLSNLNASRDTYSNDQLPQHIAS
jgi:hypothetical protein